MNDVCNHVHKEKKRIHENPNDKKKRTFFRGCSLQISNIYQFYAFDIDIDKVRN